MISVIQPWVQELPLRAQGTLLTGIRGCDLAPKPMYPAKQWPVERALVAFIRYSVLVMHDPREVDIPGAFAQSEPPFEHHWKPSLLEHYPLHWYTHVMHCYEVIGYMHPDLVHADKAFNVYRRMARAMHLYPEPRDVMLARLCEDRIASGEVVS